MSRLSSHRANAPGRQDKAIKQRKAWRVGEPIIVIGKDRNRQSAKRYRKHVAEFRQWCDYIRRRFSIPLNREEVVQKLVVQVMPKFVGLLPKEQK